jgi:hypothetical protein
MERASWLPVLLLLAAAGNARADPQVPCYFVFGDSLVDNGNNNDIASLARANYPPYGIDFPNGATGRFSNGLTTVDAICKHRLPSSSSSSYSPCVSELLRD